MSFDAVIFDCDGVLIDSEVLAMKGERAALSGCGLDYAPEEFVRRFMGLHDGAYFDALRTDYRARLGVAAPSDFEELVLAGRRREMHALVAITGAGAALGAARDAFGKVAVASSSRANHLEGKLKRTGLHDLAAPHIYSADLVPHGKPAPDIFLYAADKLGVSPARCLVLEDSVNGVRAGLAAGMTVWGFTGGGHCFAGWANALSDAGASRIIADFRVFSAAIAAP